MDGIAQYLLSVTGAAILCGIVGRFLGKKGASGVAKLVTGLVLTLAVVAPLKTLRADMEKDFSFDFSEQAQEAICDGRENARAALADIIKEQTGAYILQKANALGADIRVSVEVSDDDLPTPVRVSIDGTADAYTKKRLQAVIEQDLGIAKEDQRWT